MNYIRFTALILALTVMPATAWSATKTIGASKDNTIYQSAVNNSAGGGAGIFSGTNGTGSPRRGLLAFDIAANVPAGATITAAQLTMYLGNAPNNNDQTIDLHRLSVDWGEGTAGSSTPGVGGGGGGFPANSGDATWNTPTFGSGAWTNPGATGDFIAVASASTVVSGPVETAFTWNSTPALVSDVQGWLINPATNFGWALVNANEATSTTVKVFYSRSATQNASSSSLDPAFRPMLTITYIPEPAAAMLFLLACPLAIVHRRR
jgi:hypothetical protein